jgi:pimeloyl-ACP methyl ester carboxylesterase
MANVISKDGTRIAFERSGAGPALILVDGAFCSRAFGPMPKLAPLLAQHFTVFMYDRRGRGASGDATSYAKEREVEDVAALIREAGGSAFVYGVSSGAALAIEAMASGLPIDRLALYEPPFMVDEGGRKPPSDHHKRLVDLISWGRRSDAVRFFMREIVGMPAVVVALMRLIPGVWPKLKAVAHTLPYDAAIMGDYSLPAQRLASIEKATLVMSGEKTDVRLRHAVLAVAKALRLAQHRTLKDQTHDVKAESVAPVLVEFFTA